MVYVNLAEALHNEVPIELRLHAFENGVTFAGGNRHLCSKINKLYIAEGRRRTCR